MHSESLAAMVKQEKHIRVESNSESKIKERS